MFYYIMQLIEKNILGMPCLKSIKNQNYVSSLSSFITFAPNHLFIDMQCLRKIVL